VKIAKGNLYFEEITEILSGKSSIIIDTDPLSLYNQFHPPFSFPMPAKDVKKVVSRPDIRHENVMVFSSSEDDVSILMNSDLPDNVKILYDNTDGSWTKIYPYSYYRKIDPDRLYSHLTDFQILDIREEFELFTGFIEGSINLPFSKIMEQDIDLEKNRTYAIICAHGNRSRVAVELLSSRGFEVYDVPGGIQKWLEMGFPVSYVED